MGFKVDDAVNLLNIQYGVCFGVGFAHHFLEPTSISDLGLYLPSSPLLWVSALFLTLYFFLDWATVNTLRVRQHLGDANDRVSLPRVVSLSLWIWFLGAVVTLGGTPENVRLLVLSIYAMAAGTYHCWNYVTGWYPSARGVQFLGTLLGVAVVVLSLVLFLRWSVESGTPPDDLATRQLFMGAVSGLVVIKVVHLWLLSTGKRRQA